MNARQAATKVRTRLNGLFNAEGDRVEVDATNTERVFGFVVSGSFGGAGSTDRQQRVWSVLQDLEPEVRQRISMILALTPAEFEEMDEPDG